MWKKNARGNEKSASEFSSFKCVVFTDIELLILIRDYQPIKTHVLRGI